MYYEFIKEQVIKRHVCPNFISIVLYKKDTDSNIRFSKLRVIKRQHNSVLATDRDLQNQRDINTKHQITQPLNRTQLKNRQATNNLYTSDPAGKQQIKDLLVAITNYNVAKVNGIVDSLPYELPISDLRLSRKTVLSLLTDS